MEKKCKICGNPADKSNVRAGLCSKHFMQYNRQRKTDGRSLSDFIKLHTMDVEADKTDYEQITADNAEEQKKFWQAKKEQEHALRLARENKVRAQQLVDKAESKQAVAMVLRGVVQNLENNLDAWPVELEHKSAGEIKKIMVVKVEQLMKSCLEFLDDV